MRCSLACSHSFGPILQHASLSPPPPPPPPHVGQLQTQLWLLQSCVRLCCFLAIPSPHFHVACPMHYSKDSSSTGGRIMSRISNKNVHPLYKCTSSSLGELTIGIHHSREDGDGSAWLSCESDCHIKASTAPAQLSVPRSVDMKALEMQQAACETQHQHSTTRMRIDCTPQRLA